jgi:hypothetical protein
MMTYGIPLLLLHLLPGLSLYQLVEVEEPSLLLRVWVHREITGRPNLGYEVHRKKENK